VAKPLIGSLVHEVVCRERDINDHIPEPDGGPTGFDDAARSAMEHAPKDHALRTVATVAALIAGGILASVLVARSLRVR
jgi:hypothetical protein